VSILQRQMVQWARDIVALAPSLPAAVATERAGSVALKLISALDDAGQVTPAAIARTFPKKRASYYKGWRWASPDATHDPPIRFLPLLSLSPFKILRSLTIAVSQKQWIK
jgi:hypothetical protein